MGIQWDDEAERKFSELFDQLDKDGSGTLTFAEMKNAALKQGASAVAGIGASDEDIHNFIKTVDKDGDGMVSKDEFRQFLQEFIAALQSMNKSQAPPSQTTQQKAPENRQSLNQQLQSFEWNEKAEAKFQEIFKELDEDGSGSLTFDEIRSSSLKKCVRLFGHNPTDAEVQTFMNKVDVDGDGVISQDEFRAYIKGFIEMLKDPEKLLEEAVDTMMKAIDTDGNGLCSKDEFKTFVQEKGSTPLTDKEVDELFNAVDTDGDKSTLSREELLTVLKIGLAKIMS